MPASIVCKGIGKMNPSFCEKHRIKKVLCPCGCGVKLCPECEVERVKNEIDREQTTSTVLIGVPERPLEA